jgi:hypothetical protein
MRDYRSLILSEANYGGLPLAYWPLDEVAGTTAADLMLLARGAAGAAATHSSVTVGAAGRVPRERSAAVDYSSASAITNAGSPSYLDDLAALTIEAWLYPRSLGGGNAGRIVQKAGNGLGGWIFFTDTTPSLGFLRGHSGGNMQIRSTSGSLAFNAWQHVAVTWAGGAAASDATLYINGVATSNVVNTNGSGSPTSDAGNDVTIGNRPDLSRRLDGVLQHLAIYDYVMSADRFMARYLYGRDGFNTRRWGRAA